MVKPGDRAYNLKGVESLDERLAIVKHSLNIHIICNKA